jgi:hypothetical protein
MGKRAKVMGGEWEGNERGRASKRKYFVCEEGWE